MENTLILRMYLILWLTYSLLIHVLPVAALEMYYCPQNHGFIKIGMSPEEVEAACGPPLSKQESNKPVMQQIPMLQLFYNNQGTPSSYYGVWALPTGVGTGQRLEVDVINNKVSAIRLNGENINASSITSNIDTNMGNTNDTTVCSGEFKIGDPVQKVYNACGDPPIVNNTFVNQPILSNRKPVIWIYQPSEYEQQISLTFVNGHLQSIQ